MVGVDTVEWGGVEPDRRRIPGLWDRLPRVGALTLAVLGFAAFAAAELVPWGTAHVPSSPDGIVHGARGPFADGHGVLLNQVQSMNLLTYHLAVIALLGAAGVVVTGGATRRRASMGATLGLAGGTGIMTMSMYYGVTHYFDSFYSDLGTPDPAGLPVIAGGPGVFVAVAGLGLLVAAALTAGLGLRGGRRTTPPGVPAAVMPASRAPEEDRELTVSGLEPFDEAYFAHPDTR
jgi:hypothetical protein